MSENDSRSRIRWPAAAALDVALVLVFATIGRASHERGLSPLGILETAWPFLAALAVGWLVLAAWRAPAAPLRTGLPLAAITVAGGMVLRLVSGAGAAIPFIIVASITVVVLLVGWRAIARLVAPSRSRSRSAGRPVTPR
ncbi:DUF3054 domain-containing protein [Agromyces aerolatus]|uniref:DUF3054 domain-containing protein n=1 Tax=Agromyces sp. LY-1074 TaxID=3074080 RepID=UPI00285A9138|nr:MULTISPECIES: DUF3054 domain-containing protein [unclassified Agromyces]MDR5701712.1 DUF3054 domain-containing protein [Agromyces sp. LY-1074]MDR5707941.1 DUF3054 domain-containing protein [Agromyces sp. LY-1358]